MKYHVKNIINYREIYLPMKENRNKQGSAWVYIYPEKNKAILRGVSDIREYPEELLLALAKKKVKELGVDRIVKLLSFQEIDIPDYDEQSTLWKEKSKTIEIAPEVGYVHGSLYVCDEEENVLAIFGYQSHESYKDTVLENFQFSFEEGDNDDIAYKDLFQEFFSFVKASGVREVSYTDYPDWDGPSKHARILMRKEIGFSYSGSGDPHWDGREIDYYVKRL